MHALRGIVASWVWTGERQQAPLTDGAVVLDATERVVAVGAASELRDTYRNAAWEQHAAVVMPGLVNAHLHLELSRLRGEVAGGAGFVPWVRNLLAARQRFAPEADGEAIEAAISELLRAGTVAIGEVSNTLASVSALGGLPLVGRVFHEVFGTETAQARAAWQAAHAQREALGSAWPRNLSYVLAPHTPYTLPPEVLRGLVDEARAVGMLTSLHLAEHAAERAYLMGGEGPFAAFLQGMGLTRDWAVPGTDAIRYVEQLGGLAPDVLAVHLADARPDEIARVAQTKAPVVLCPRSNLHIQASLPPLKALLDADIEPALGTDSLASALSLDVLAEAVSLRERFPWVTSDALLAMVTRNGARALRLDHQVGRLALGLQPGLVAFPHAGPPPSHPADFVLERARHGLDGRRVLASGPREILGGSL